MSSFLQTDISFLKGLGPKKAEVINKELRIFNFEDFLTHYPFRYEDKTKIYQIAEKT